MSLRHIWVFFVHSVYLGRGGISNISSLWCESSLPTYERIASAGFFRLFLLHVWCASIKLKDLLQSDDYREAQKTLSEC